MMKATRKPQIKPGTVRRLTGGGIAVDFIADEPVDLGAPEIAVTSPASIERISDGQIRVSYYSMRKDGPVIVLHVIWDLKRYLDSFAMHKQVGELLSSGRMQPGDGGRRNGKRGEAH